MVVILIGTGGGYGYKVSKKWKAELLELRRKNAIQRNIITDLRYMMYSKKDWSQVEQFMLGQGISRIAIYGMGILGQELANLMENSKIKICYGIDKRKKDTSCEVREPDQIDNDMDMIIVTAEFDYTEIRRQLEELVNVPIVLLSDLLEEIMAMPISIDLRE